jgi:hypothetical protein
MDSKSSTASVNISLNSGSERKFNKNVIISDQLFAFLYSISFNILSLWGVVENTVVTYIKEHQQFIIFLYF